jgi:Tfp pilus assembly protein PilF
VRRTLRTLLPALALGIVGVALSACSTSGGDGSRAADAPSNPLGRAMRAGVEAINDGDAARANQELNLAIGRDLKNPALHAANALAYQLRTRAGERDLFDLAETGYLIALEQRHDFQSAALQLTHLYYDNHRYPQAQRAAAYALQLDSGSTEALYLLAAASYYAGDAELALWAIDRARTLAPQDPVGLRMVPAIYAGAGLTDEAQAFLDAHRDAFGPQADTLKRRVAEWDIAYKTASATPKKAEADAAAKPADAQAADGATAAEQGPLAYAWSDCKQQLNEKAAAAAAPTPAGADGKSSDETIPMPALPSPCKARGMPRMAVIDVTILRTDEFNTTTHGINLLDSLAVTIQRNATHTVTKTTGEADVTSTVLTNTVGLGTSAGGAIAYSLNLANVSGQRAEVIARPSLIMLDRQPSQFFSGSNLSIGLPANAGGNSTLEQINVGVSLSVTPTFIDDNQILLNVKAVRTFFEPITTSSTFSQSLEVSRNMVSAAANVKVNETLVLSGLTEHETANQSSGVPVLKDIPGVQYLFSKDTKQIVDQTVLVLITPRVISTYGQTLDKVDALKVGDTTEPKLLRETRARALKELGGRWPNLYGVIHDLDQSARAFDVRSNDIRFDDWEKPSHLHQVLQDLTDALYF